MTIRKAVMCLTLVALAAAFAAPVRAQTAFATLRGTVHDEQGGVLPGVTITVRQLETNTTRSTVTNEQGQYYSPNLPAGTWELSAELSGFSTLKQQGIRLGVGQDFTLNVTMKVGAVQETVTVSGRVALVETQSTLGTMIEKKALDELPTVGRDFASLARLAPGTTASNYSGTNLGTGVSFGGQRQYQNNIMVDGASNLMQFYGRQANNFPQDWIQEFQVLTSSFAAEFGQASGGMLNVITRSGTNALNGRGYGFFRDAKLDSPPYAGRFVNGAPTYLPDTPPFNQKRIGGFLGGPVVRDSLFFFAGVEYLNRNDTTVLGISDYWRNRGVQTLIPGGHQETDVVIKPDWNLSDKHRLSARYNTSIWHDKNVSLGGSPLDTIDTRYTFDGPLWNVMANLASTLGNQSFNEAKLYYGVNKPLIGCNMAGGLGGLALLEADGNMGQNGKFATINYPGANFGCTSFTGLEGEANLYLTDNFSFIIGKHQVKVGAQLARNVLYMDVEASHKGRWGMPSDTTFDINNPASYPDTFSGNISLYGAGVATHVAWSPGVFTQDTWQVRNNLTLNLGVRYEVDHTFLAGNEWVDEYNARIVARFGGPPPAQKIALDKNNVAPRLGFVWVPTSDRHTTVRGSFGLFYDQNHYNYSDIWINETLQSVRRISFNANDAALNPFWPNRAAMRAYLAANFPGYPNLSQAPGLKENELGLDPNIKVPYTAQSSVGVTHGFGFGLDVQADYVYSHGYDMIIGGNRNWQQVNGKWVPLDPRFASINLYWNDGFITYHGLQTRAQYRHGTKAVLGLSYTLSRTMSNTTAGITGGSATWPFDLSIDYGPDNADRRHNLVGNVSYLFPWDIQLAGILIYRSALPWSVTSRLNPQNLPYIPRPEPRNSQRGDSEKGTDLRLSKNFRFGRYQASIFWEMFNTFNFDNFLSYQGSLQSSTFGLPGSALPRRQQQLGVKFDF